MSFFEDAIGSLGKSLANSATSYLSETTGLDVGGTLAFMFGNDQTSGEATLNNLIANLSSEFKGNAASLALLKDSLNAQSVQLTNIGAQLSSMATAISGIYGEIQGLKGLLQQISQQNLYISWQVQDDYIKSYRGSIDSTFSQYASYIQQGAKVADVTALVANILESNTGELMAASQINNYMLDDGSNKGALTLWVNMVCPVINAGLLDFRQAAEQFKNYYTKMVWAQLRATNLVIEARNFNDDNVLASRAWTDYQALILSQETQFIGGMIAIVNAGLCTAASPPKGIRMAGLGYRASDQFHPDHYPMVGSEAAYYEPSDIFGKAEGLLAELFLSNQADRRIVVHMVYLGDAFKTAVDSATVTIKPTDSNFGEPILPSGESFEFGPFTTAKAGGPWFPDKNWCTEYSFYVKRLVYTPSSEQAFPDGRYSLTNLNGQGSLVPIDTYTSTKPSFQTDAVLGYVMEINQTQQFDFMNFAAYFAQLPDEHG